MNGVPGRGLHPRLHAKDCSTMQSLGAWVNKGLPAVV
jgi:hypothetical protein